jgi:hypothetical protein
MIVDGQCVMPLEVHRAQAVARAHASSIIAVAREAVVRASESFPQVVVLDADNAFAGALLACFAPHAKQISARKLGNLTICALAFPDAFVLVTAPFAGRVPSVLDEIASTMLTHRHLLNAMAVVTVADGGVWKFDLARGGNAWGGPIS